MTRTALSLAKTDRGTSAWAPLERGEARTGDLRAARVVVSDGARRPYFSAPLRPGRPARFRARGTAGLHVACLLDAGGAEIGRAEFTLAARTRFACARGPYAALARRVELLLRRNDEARGLVIGGRLYRMLVTWGRDHVHTLKAAKYFLADVQSGLDYWLDTQEPDGMFWDCVHPNPDHPGRTWFGEALGRGYFRYDEGGRFIVRRIPVEADCEFLYAEGVWTAWKASGDDAWMARQLPRLEKALRYNTSHPARWSRRHGLVRRSMCMDSWDFVNPHYCRGDHRCINPGDPQFLFHGDNSGLYSFYRRLAEMHEAAGHGARAAALRREGEALRQRANAKLFFGNAYGHMIPETLPEAKVYARVGDERRRLSLSTGYTINRGLPTHAMAVRILREYRRRGRANRSSSFAEWWTMDPPYRPDQWPGRGTGGSTVGEYMNGAICPIVAGELARAAFEHGMEDYGVDILDRLWQLSERDGGALHQVYRRLPENPPQPRARFRPLDLRAAANRGLRHRAARGVEAWTGEGPNDLRGLPVGRRRFGAIEFAVADPARNGGRAVLRLDADPAVAPAAAEVAAGGRTARSVWFLHATARSAPPHTAVAEYELVYEDGSSERLPIRTSHEIGHWWGVTDRPDERRGLDPVDRAVARVAWRGANGQWANVGVYMTGWLNPRPDRPIAAVRLRALPVRGGRGGVMVAAISLGDGPVEFETRIRSFGLPDCWSQAAVYHALAEGLAGIEDRDRAYRRVRVAPRWAATRSDRYAVALHYPASGAYCAYEGRLDRRRRRLVLDLTGSFESADVHALLPREARRVVRVRAGGRDVPFRLGRVGGARYADFALEGLPRGPVTIEYAARAARRKP